MPFVPLHSGLPLNYQVLVFDGDCAFCARCVRFILDRDERNTLFFAARRSAFGAALEARHPELTSVSSVLWVTGDDVLGELVATRWNAVHHMGSYLGGLWEQLTRCVDFLVPIRLLDAGYALIAAIRHRLTAGMTCRVPTPDDRRRLLV